MENFLFDTASDSHIRFNYENRKYTSYKITHENIILPQLLSFWYYYSFSVVLLMALSRASSDHVSRTREKNKKNEPKLFDGVCVCVFIYRTYISSNFMSLCFYMRRPYGMNEFSYEHQMRKKSTQKRKKNAFIRVEFVSYTWRIRKYIFFVLCVARVLLVLWQQLKNCLVWSRCTQRKKKQ